MADSSKEAQPEEIPRAAIDLPSREGIMGNRDEAHRMSPILEEEDEMY